MASTYLTDTKIKNLKIKNDKLISDCVPNLYLKPNQSGGGSWIFKFVDPKSRKRPKMSIGRYPLMSINQARLIATEYNDIVQNGGDPRVRQEEKQLEEKINSITFKEMTERYIEEFYRYEVLDVSESMNRVRNHIFPLFGDMPLHRIKLAEWHEKIKPIAQKSHNTAQKISSTCKQVLDHAKRCGIIEHNPLDDLRRSFGSRRSKPLPAIQYHRLPEFMRDLYYRSNSQYLTKLLIEWGLLTATRPNESARARWDEIDLERGLWIIPEEKMKAKVRHIIALSSQALAILNELSKQRTTSPYLFEGRNGGHISTQTANDAIKNIDGGKYKGLFVSHSMRTIFSSYLNDMGENKDHIDVCLAHKIGNSVSQSYNRAEYIEIKKRLMQIWGDYVEQCKKS